MSKELVLVTKTDTDAIVATMAFAYNNNLARCRSCCFRQANETVMHYVICCSNRVIKEAGEYSVMLVDHNEANKVLLYQRFNGDELLIIIGSLTLKQ